MPGESQGEQEVKRTGHCGDKNGGRGDRGTSCPPVEYSCWQLAYSWQEAGNGAVTPSCPLLSFFPAPA